jgi:hypothetical protein
MGKDDSSRGVFGQSGLPGTQATNMEVDGNAASSSDRGNMVSSSNHNGKSVSLSHSADMAITPYNVNPRTPRGIAIVERVRRLSPQLVRDTFAEAGVDSVMAAAALATGAAVGPQLGRTAPAAPSIGEARVACWWLTGVCLFLRRLPGW